MKTELQQEREVLEEVMKKDIGINIEYMKEQIANNNLSYSEIIEIDIAYNKLIGRPDEDMLSEDQIKEIELLIK